MKTKGNGYRRFSCYAAHAEENATAAAAMEQNYKVLSSLRTSDIACDVFQITYMRITARYQGGDFVKEFRALFYSTLREITLKLNGDKLTHKKIKETDGAEENVIHFTP